MTNQMKLCGDDIIATTTFKDVALLDNDGEDSMRSA